MKSYLEIADRVFERGEAVREENRKRKKRIITLSSSLTACFIVGIAIWTVLDKGIAYKNEAITTDKDNDFTGQFATENGTPVNNNGEIAEEYIKEDEHFLPNDSEGMKERTNDSYSVANGSSEVMETGEAKKENDGIQYSQNSPSVSESADNTYDNNEMRSSFNTAVDTEKTDKIYTVIIEVYYGDEFVDDLTVLESERDYLAEEGLQVEIITDGDRKVLAGKMTLSDMERLNFIDADSWSVNADEYSYVTRIID